jgi:hypothetical protein
MDRCLTFCGKSLDHSPCNPKPLFRRVLVLEHKCEFSAALSVLEDMQRRAIGVEDDVVAAMQRIHEKNAVQTAAQRQVYRSMFSNSGTQLS